MVLSVQSGEGSAPRAAAATSLSSSSQEHRTKVDMVNMMGGEGCESVDMLHSDSCVTPSAGRRERPSTGTGSPIRLLVLGSHAVGKSAITVRYLTRRFIGEYRSQVDIIYRQTVQLDGFTVDLEIIDISTHPSDETLPTLEICQCDCYLVVYSVADKGTFISANQLLNAILKLRPQFPHPPITLLGNKQDLEHSREVSVEEGSHAAQVFGCAFKEVSVAETSEDIVPVFSSLIHRTQALRRIQLPKQSLGNTMTNKRRSASPAGSHCNCPSCGNYISDSRKNRSGRCSSLRLDIQAANSRRNRVSGVDDNDVGFIKNKVNKPTNIGKLETNVVKYQLAKSEVKKSLTKSFSSSLPRNLIQRDKEPKMGNEDKSVQDDKLNFKMNKHRLSRKTSAHVRTRGNSSYNDVKLPNRNKTTIHSTISSDTDQSDQECSHGPVCRSFSSPECNCLILREKKCKKDSTCLNHSSKTNKTDNITASNRFAEPGFLSTRSRSFIVDSKSRCSEKQPSKCSCHIPNRHGSFKSSGKLEIVTVQNPKTNSLKSNVYKSIGNSPYRDYSLPYSYRSPSPKPKSKLNCNTGESLEFKPLQQLPHTRSLRLLKTLASDSPESSSCTSPEESCSPTSRQRKFSVFGNFRALGNFLSNGSMPDLPSAKANLTDRFGSIKKVFKKRSV